MIDIDCSNAALFANIVLQINIHEATGEKVTANFKINSD